jgi:hypothetical protein
MAFDLAVWSTQNEKVIVATASKYSGIAAIAGQTMIFLKKLNRF